MEILGPDTADRIVEYRGGHLRVLGPPGSGKTSLLARRFHYLAGADGGKSDVAVITYTRSSHCELTARLLNQHSARFGRIPVYTYHELALAILSSAWPAGRRMIGGIEERVILSRILGRRGLLDSDYASIAGSETFRRALLGVVQILLQHEEVGYNLDSLTENARDEHTRDILHVFREYRSYLDNHGFFTYFDSAWRAARLLADRPELNPLGRASVLLFDDFHDVDAGQYKLIETLAPVSGGVEVDVFGDPSGARFRDRGTSDRYLKEVFPARYAPQDFVLPMVNKNPAALGSTLEALLEELAPERGGGDVSGEGPSNPPQRHYTVPSAPNVEVSLDIAEDEVAECQAVAEKTAELLLTKKYGPEEIAVVARRKEKYERTLFTAFTERGIPIDGGRRERHAAELFLVSFLFLLEKPKDEFLIESVISSPLYREFKTLFVEKAGPGFSARLTGSEEEQLKSLLAQVSKSLVAGKNGFDMRGFLDVCFGPLKKNLGPTKTSQDLLSFLGALVDEWETYFELAERLGGIPDLSEFLAASGVLADRAAETTVGAGRVRFYSCREFSSERLPVVFVVGCSEFLFPEPPQREAYIPFLSLQECLNDALRSSRVEFHQARPARDHLKDEYALLLDTLTRAEKALHLYAPEKHNGEYCPAPAFILSGIPRGEPAPVIGRAPAPAKKFAAEIAAGNRAARPGDGQGIPPVSGPAAADLEGPARLWTRTPLQPGAFRVRERPLSSSSLQTYTVCERRYFYDKVLGVEEEEPIYLTFGRVFHTLLQKICENNRTYGEIAQVVQSDRLEAYIDDVLGDTGGFDPGVTVGRAARHYLEVMARGLVDLDAGRVDGFEVAATEKYIEFDYKGRGFVGVIDRLDRSRALGTVTLDYKTGAASVPKKGKTVRERILAENTKPEKRLWQVPLYCRAVHDIEGRYPLAFSYYVIAPDEKPFAVGVLVGGEGGAGSPKAVFEDPIQSRFGHITPDELEACLDEAAGIAEKMFGERTRFPRTDEDRNCRNCSYNYLCGRKSSWT